MKRRLAKFIAACAVLFTLVAQTDATAANPKKVINDPAAPERKSVGLVLSGGGAKGAAQLRIIKAIEEAGIPIDYIAGTSIGSIIGGLYSVGYTVEEIEELFTSMNWFNIFTDRNERSKQLLKDKHKDDAYMFDMVLSTEDISLPTGIVRGDKFMDQLSELLLGYQYMKSFDDLPIPFACVSYDMNTGSEYVARSGSLPLAIRASMSIPGVFKPVSHNNMVLVDGGVYNNFPVDVVRDMGAEVVIGIDLADGLRTDDDLDNMVVIIEQLATFLGRDKYESNLKGCDYYMRPEIAPYSAASFNAEAVDSLIMRGQKEADAHRVGLQELRKEIGLPEGYMPTKRNRHYSENTKLYIGPITFKGFNNYEQKTINRHLDLKPYSTVTRQEFNRHIEEVRNVGGFEFVRYNLSNRAPYELVIGVNEKQNASVHVGFRFDSDEMASLLLGSEMTLRGSTFKPKFSLTTRLSQSPYFQLSASSRRVFFGNFTFAYKYQYNDFMFYKNEIRQNSSNFNLHNASIRFSDIYLRNFNMSAGVEYEYFDFIHTMYYNPDGTLAEAQNQGYINYEFKGHYESLDDFYMPHNGNSIELEYTLHTTNGLEVEGHWPFTSLYYKLMNATTPGDNRLTIITQLYGRSLIGNGVTYPYLNCMGGVLPGRYIGQQMPFVGIQHIERFDNSVMVASAEFRYEFYKNHTLSAMVNFATQDDHMLKMFQFTDTLVGFGVKYSHYTSLGPLTVIASGTNRNPVGGIYLSFGKNF